MVRLVGVTGGVSVSPESNRPKLSSDSNKTEATVVILKNDAPIRFSQVSCASYITIKLYVIIIGYPYFSAHLLNMLLLLRSSTE